MLKNETKSMIQDAYRHYLDNKNLKARFGQKVMIAEIAKCLGNIELNEEGHRKLSENDGDHICVVEAGTGTGKTIGYLLPAAVLAKELGKKLVISTATVALQEQIINKDLPELAKNSGLNFSFNIAKGRGRYICLSKIENYMSELESGSHSTRSLYEEDDTRVNFSSEQVSLYRSMMDALDNKKWSGERDTWPQSIKQDEWQLITTDHRQCAGRNCSNAENCSFLIARDSLEKVDCIVTNHDLVLADLALGGGVILPDPADTIFVFDEGHHLPQKTLNHFAYNLRIKSTQKWLRQSQKGLGALLGAISGAGDVDRYAEGLPALIMDCVTTLDEAFLLFEYFKAKIDTKNKESHYRFSSGVVPETIRECSLNLFKNFDRLVASLTGMCDEVSKSIKDPMCAVPRFDLENYYPLLGTWLARAEDGRSLWKTFAFTDNKEGVPCARWISIVDVNDIEISSSPILAAETLKEILWNRACGVVITSATITSMGNFNRFIMSVGTPGTSGYHQLPSPFDYSRSILEVPVKTVDATNAELHTNRISEQIPSIINMDTGTLVLFSSKKQMMDVYEKMPSNLKEIILLQGDASKQEIIVQHKERIDSKKGSAIFGLASFSEGVDLPGAYCTHVIIAKIPFAVPDNPIEAALAEWIDERGGNPFMELTVPDACLKLIQSCGRLVRTETDSGIISLLDKRIITKRYGQSMLNSLPPYERRFY